MDCGTVAVECSGVDPEPNERETLPQRARIREGNTLPQNEVFLVS